MKSILTLFSLAMSCIMMLSSCGKEHFPYVEESIMAGFSGAKDSLVVYDSDGSCNIFYCPSWIEATVRDSVISYTIMENKAWHVVIRAAAIASSVAAWSWNLWEV